MGCGTGVFAARIRRGVLPNAKVWGIDLVSEMLTKGGSERWRKHAGHVQPAQADSERLPFASGTFDIVTCASTASTTTRTRTGPSPRCTGCCVRGRLMLIDGYRDALWGWFIYDVCVAAVEGDVHHASSQRFRELFTQAGLRAPRRRSTAAPLRSCSPRPSPPTPPRRSSHRPASGPSLGLGNRETSVSASG